MRFLPVHAALILIVGCQSTPLEHWLVGKAELEAGNYTAAIDHLEHSKKRKADFSPAYLALAAAYSRQGDFAAVADNLRTFLELNPDHDVAHLYLAECLRAMGQWEQARDHYVLFIQKAKPSEDSHGKRLLYSYQRLAEMAQASDNKFEHELYSALAILEEIQIDRRAGDVLDDSEKASLLEQAHHRLIAAQKIAPNDPRLADSFKAWEHERDAKPAMVDASDES